MYRLFHEFAHRYDLHTPPGHYKHDHAFVIAEALRIAPTNCRLLDIGCGTGIFLEAAIAAGIDGHGVDAAPQMVDVAMRRLGDRIRLQRMQELTDENSYDVVCALSWTIHYCETHGELQDVVRRCRRALRKGGMLLLQVANDDQMTGAVNVDVERGPSGESDDTYFIYRFRPLRDAGHSVLADYAYVSRAHSEFISEEHKLKFANPLIVGEALIQSGFESVSLGDSLSISPFVTGCYVNTSEHK